MKKVLYILIPFIFIINSFAQNWTDPVNVSNMEGKDQLPDFCLDNNGVIHCVWVHVYETNFSKIFYCKSYDDGLTWTIAEDISFNDEKRLSQPHIVCDSQNNLHITYDYGTDNPYETMVYYKKFEGINWSEPFIVSGNMPESYHNNLLIDNNDRVYCTWFRSLYNNGTVFYRYFENGGWSEIFIPYDNNDFLGFANSVIDTNNNLHWIGAHHYEGQTHYEDKAIYFCYNYENNEWSDFVEFGEYHTGSGFDIDLDDSEMPHLVWQEFTNDSIPPNDGTFYTYNNGNNWTTPELIVEDPQDQQIVLEENNKPNIFDVEKFNDGSILVHYYNKQGTWEGYIIDESEWYGMSTQIANENNKLYIMYHKPIIDINGEIYFSKSDIISSFTDYQRQNLKVNIYPNPFHQKVRINFETNGSKRTLLKIYTMQGKLINTLIDENKLPGKYEIIWNGKDNNGKEVSSGLYLVRLQSGRNILTRSVQYIK